VCVCRLVLSGKKCPLNRVHDAPPVVRSDHSQFDGVVPTKSIAQLIHAREDGLFVVCAMITGLYHIEKCWFPLCDCSRIMGQADGFYRCVRCNRTTFNVSAK
jgi:hypothetical protein